MRLKSFVNIFLISSVLLLTNSCSVSSFTNKTPDVVYPAVISFDEYGEQTAGLIRVNDGKYILSKSAVDKYNALIDKWGSSKEFESMSLIKNYGIEKINDEYYSMTPKAFYTFCRLSLKQTNKNLYK